MMAGLMSLVLAQCPNLNAELDRMGMAEIVLQLDRGSAKNIKEERIGLKKEATLKVYFSFHYRR